MQDALGCECDECSNPNCECRRTSRKDCLEHDVAWAERGCPVAVAAADAAAPWIAAQTLEDTARAWQTGEGFTVMAPKGVGIPAIDYAQRALDWLRARADHAGATQ